MLIWFGFDQNIEGYYQAESHRPFYLFSWLDLHSNASRMLPMTAKRGPERGRVKQRLGLTELSNRHDAKDVNLILDMLYRIHRETTLRSTEQNSARGQRNVGLALLYRYLYTRTFGLCDRINQTEVK